LLDGLKTTATKESDAGPCKRLSYLQLYNTGVATCDVASYSRHQKFKTNILPDQIIMLFSHSSLTLALASLLIPLTSASPFAERDQRLVTVRGPGGFWLDNLQTTVSALHWNPFDNNRPFDEGLTHFTPQLNINGAVVRPDVSRVFQPSRFIRPVAR
jgi:hypothetical protein